jgi:hypothetical protein
MPDPTAPSGPTDPLEPIPRPPGSSGAVPAADPLRREVALAAARWVAEAGLDYGSAKRRAVDELFDGGSVPRGALPDTAEIDEALREHLALFDDGHPARVARMRGVALALMRRLEEFRPYLTGAVWKGIVADHAPIHIQLFHDDVKDVGIRLLNDGMRFEAGEVPHFRGGPGRSDVEALTMTWRDEPVLLSLYGSDDLRGALRGVPAERGDAEAVERLLDATPGWRR